MNPERHQMEEDDSEPPMPELKLALAIVLNALKDVRVGSRAQRPYEDDTLYVMHQLHAADAKDFLLRRLSEDDNPWGRVLREYGLRPMTLQRLPLVVRQRPTKQHREVITLMRDP